MSKKRATSDATRIRRITGASKSAINFAYVNYCRAQKSARRPHLSRDEWQAQVFRALATEHVRRDQPASISSQKHAMAPDTPA